MYQVVSAPVQALVGRHREPWAVTQAKLQVLIGQEISEAWYIIRMSPFGEDQWTILTNDVEDQFYEISGLTLGQIYDVQVRACVDIYCSPWSETLRILIEE